MTDNEHVENYDVHVENQDRGWMVVGVFDGERKEFGDPHPDKETAETYAKHMFSSADRWTDAASKVDPEPAKYPGDGQPGA